MRLISSFCCSNLAAMAIELKKQNPIAWAASAWWPGGLTIAKPFLMSPLAAVMCKHVCSIILDTATHNLILEFQVMLCSPLKARSVTQPTAIRAAGAVCNSFHVVSESTPMPPQGNRTKLLRESSESLFASIFCRFNGLVPVEQVFSK